MTQTVYVLNLPSPQQEQWQNDLVAAAQRAGRSVLFETHGPVSASSAEERIVFCENFIPDAGEISDWFILADRTTPTAVHQAQKFDIPVSDANRSISRRYAHANVAANLGIKVFSSASDVVDVPGLGVVTRSGPPYQRCDHQGPLAFYDQLPLRAKVCAEWSRNVFFGPLSATSGPLDLTGRRRLLQHGPYFDLAPGTWGIKLVFVLDAGSATTDLRFEWGTADDTVSANHSIGRPGVYEISLVRDWVDVAPAEFRIWLDNSMFDGTLDLTSCQVTHEAPLIAWPSGAVPPAP